MSDTGTRARGRKATEDVMARLAAGETVRIMGQTPEEDAQDVADLLNDVRSFFTRYIHFSYPEQADALALWAVYTHCFGQGQPFRWVPYMLITSAEYMSGKSTILDLSNKVVYKPLIAEDMSPALVGRLAGGRTLLLDEIDGIYKGRPTDGDGKAMDLRSILNGGFGHLGTYARLEQTKGGSFEPRFWSTFGPKMLAGIGRTVPDTVKSRSIRLRVERMAPGTMVEKARDRFVELISAPLVERIEAIAEKIGELPFIDEMPDVLGSRDQDIWEPLIALADQAAGEWPATVRAAAVKLSESEPYMSNGVRLLSDIRAIFESTGWPVHLPTKDIIGRPEDPDTRFGHDASGLCAVEDFAWGEWRGGKPITSTSLAKLLSEFDIASSREHVGRDDYGPAGYALAAFSDAWGRYLPEPSGAA